MDPLFSFFTEYGTNILGALFTLHAFAVLVVNMTPTPADDEIVGKMYVWLERLAGIFSINAKELPGERASDEMLAELNLDDDDTVSGG